MTAPSLETTPAQPRSGGPDAFEAQPSQAESPFPYPPLSRTAVWGGGTGRGVRVAVVDSGIDRTHPELSRCSIGGVVVNQVGRRAAFAEYQGRDAFGHGTACAGIISRLAPEAELFSVQVLGQNLRGMREIVVAGIRHAVGEGAHVINLSLGTTDPQFGLDLVHVMREAYERNVVVVAAAGYDASRADYPSCLPFPISVDYDYLPEPETYYVRPGKVIEFVAHGVQVHVPWLDHGYYKAVGSSFAAPHITGLVARIRSKHPHLTPSQIKDLLTLLANGVDPKMRKP